MTPEQQVIAWVGFVAVVMGVIFQGLQFFGVKPSLFVLSYSEIALGFVIGGGALIVLFLILRAATNRRLAKYIVQLKGVTPSANGGTQPSRSEEELITLSIIPSLAHLTIHFAHRNATPTNPNVKCFVVNTSTNQAYWVTEYLLELSKRGRILWVAHDGEADTVRYLAAAGIAVNYAYPKNWELAGH